MQSSNNNQMFESMFACFRVGAVWVPTNYRQSPDEVAYLAKASGARGMICASAFPDHAKASHEASTIDFSIAIGTAEFGEDYDAIVARHMGRKVKSQAVDRDDPCWFFFTSGTTGRPKAAVLTHGQMAFVITNHLCDLMPGTGPDDASIVVAPLSHGAGIHQLVQVAHGAKTVLPAAEKLDVPAVWALIEKWRITNAFTVPTILKMLVEDPLWIVSITPHCAMSSMLARRCIARTRNGRLQSSARCWCNILGWVKSPGTSPCCRLLFTTPRTVRKPGSAPAASTVPAWKCRSRTMRPRRLAPVKPVKSV